MGFPSPAADYVETTIRATTICNITANSVVLETSTGYAVMDRALRIKQGDCVLVITFGRNQFVTLRGKTLVTDDGEVIAGEALDDVTVVGCVTHFVIRTRGDSNPVI